MDELVRFGINWRKICSFGKILLNAWKICTFFYILVNVLEKYNVIMPLDGIPY